MTFAISNWLTGAQQCDFDYVTTLKNRLETSADFFSGPDRFQLHAALAEIVYDWRHGENHTASSLYRGIYDCLEEWFEQSQESLEVVTTGKFRKSLYNIIMALNRQAWFQVDENRFLSSFFPALLISSLVTQEQPIV